MFEFIGLHDSFQFERASAVDAKGVIDSIRLFILRNNKGIFLGSSCVLNELAQIVRTVYADSINIRRWIGYL